MTELVLYGDSGWVSPWVFHAMVALEEKGLPYRLELVPLPIPPADKALLRDRSIVGKVPVLVHGDLWLGESSAISEYLAEVFPSTSGYPRLFAADYVERARGRQIASWLRTGFAALREDRPTSSIFGPHTDAPLSERGAADAAELLRVATAAIGDRLSIASAWSIADADLALMLDRLVANRDPVPPQIASYVEATWSRPSVQRYVSQATAHWASR